MSKNPLGLVAIALEDIVFANWNYKGNSEYTMAALEDNLLRNGQIINLIVRELDDGKYEAVNGNHRLEALRKLGKPYAACKNLGKITREEAIRQAIETNETNFRSNVGKLANTVVAAVEKTEFNIETDKLPFDQEEVHRFKEMTAIDWDQKSKPPREGSAAAQKAAANSGNDKEKTKKAQKDKTKEGPLYDCPHCGHQFSEE